MPDLSPLAPPRPAQPPPLAGARLASAACGLRYRGRDDLCLIELAEGTTVAGVLTRSRTASAPVEWCRGAQRGGAARAILINSGNANAFTGAAGVAAVAASVDGVAALLGCPREQVFVASTGVIGEPLAHERITKTLPALGDRLSEDGWSRAAASIMTTDTFAKLATRRVEIAGTTVTLNGIAKGSGMIAPDMATLLAFVVTDASLPADVLRTLLVRANQRSFNAITVDSDTSTSDTVLLCATGQARHAAVDRAGAPALKFFRAALEDLLKDLARQIVRDGEGASKFVTITVTGATSEKAARRIGLTVANSPLVKTAIAGEDANWGRIVMAVGKSGEQADRDRLAIRIGGIAVAEAGAVVPNYDETPVAAHMEGQEIDIDIDVGVGKGQATVWTCDLTHGYIKINADYRS